MSSTDEDPLDTLAFRLLVDLVEISGDKWVAPARFAAIVDAWNVQDPQARIVLLTAILRLMRSMPVRVFRDLDHRQSLLDAAQHALDAAIEIEHEQE